MLTRSTSATGPASSLRTIRMRLTPVSHSPLAIADWMGEAPRYFGSSEVCKFNVPSRGVLMNSSRRMWPYAITRATSAPKAASCARTSSVSFSGWKTGNPRASAHVLISFEVIF